MTKEETKQVWGGLSLRRKFMFTIARYLPFFLPSILQRNTVDKINRFMKLTRKGVGEKVDKSAPCVVLIDLCVCQMFCINHSYHETVVSC